MAHQVDRLSRKYSWLNSEFTMPAFIWITPAHSNRRAASLETRQDELTCGG